jgi:uncharacterized protein
MILNLIVLAKKYSIYRFRKDSILPDWIYSSDFYSVTKTKDELSVIAAQTNSVLDDIAISKDWRIFKIIGPLDLSLIGIIAEVSKIFMERKISIFTISTYDTDYILVKEKDINLGVEALRDKGHIISYED